MTDEPNSCVIRLFCPEQMELIILSFVLCIFTNKLLFVEYVTGGVFFLKDDWRLFLHQLLASKFNIDLHVLQGKARDWAQVVFQGQI